MNTPSQFFENENPHAKDMEHILLALKIFFVSACMALLNWLVPIKSFIACTLVLVVADLITGILAAQKRGEVVNSKGLRRSVVKFTSYIIAQLAANSVQTVYFPDFPMVVSISVFISGTELWSVLENVGTTTGTPVLEAVRGFLQKTLNKKEE